MKIQAVRTAAALAGLAALCAVMAATGSPAGAEEPRVYTNADLAALPQPQLPSAPLARPAAEVTPSLAYEPPRFESRAPASPAREEAIFLAEIGVERARAVVDDLEAKLRAVEDPFLPRPLLTAEEQRAWLHLDNVQRARVVEEQIADAVADLVAAESLLARLRAEA
jgi:plasmid stabilization system protein ParE